MLVGHEHLAVRHVGEAAHLEEEDEPLRGMLLHSLPLFVGEPAGFVDDLAVDGHFADVVEERAEAELVELCLAEIQPLPDDHTEYADVHRVGERVLVEPSQGRHGHHGRLVVQHLIHDSLHRPA